MTPNLATKFFRGLYLLAERFNLFEKVVLEKWEIVAPLILRYKRCTVILSQFSCITPHFYIPSFEGL